MSLYVNPTNSMIPYQYDNPTDEQRHEQLKYLLSQSGRIEDYDNIIELLSPPPDIMSICPKGCGKGVRVAVIGAGEAGLSAAFELRKTGCDIAIFEASSRVGGRILTQYFDREKRHLGELGAMRIPVSHETTWHYINLFKLKTSPFATRNVNGLFYLRGSRAVNDPEGKSVIDYIYPCYNLAPEEKITPWFYLTERVIRKYLYSLEPEKRRELLERKHRYSNEINAIDKLNYRLACENAGLSQQAIAMLGFLSTFEQTFYRLSLTEVLQEFYSADFQFTYRIDGGMINLPLSFYMALCDEIPGVFGSISKEELGRIEFRMQCPVDGIYSSPDGYGVVLEYRMGEKFEPLFDRFDYCICAIPFTSLRRINIKPLFGVIKMQAIKEMNYESGQKTLLYLKDRFWEMGPFNVRIVGGSTATDLSEIAVFYPSDHAMAVPGKMNTWDLRPGASPFEPGVLIASYNWAMDDLRLGERYDSLKIYDIKRDIERIHGLPYRYIDEKLLDVRSQLWSKVQYIWGGGCLTKPEDKIHFSYVVTLPEMDNKIFFAGEHISQKHVWQQGSLQTGMEAANRLAQVLKTRKA